MSADTTHADQDGGDDEELTRAERREQYERILGIVDANTGGKQRPMAALSTVRTIAGYCGIGATHTNKRLRAATEQDDLVIVGKRVCLAEADALRAAAAYEAEREHPREERLGAINTALQEVDDGK
jgi:hypothetical protein